MKINFIATVLEDKITQFTDQKTGEIIENRNLVVFIEDENILHKIKIPKEYKAPEKNKPHYFESVRMTFWKMEKNSGLSFSLIPEKK
jgi:hypothetical protein